jgi:hypothetical protein
MTYADHESAQKVCFDWMTGEMLWYDKTQCGCYCSSCFDYPFGVEPPDSDTDLEEEDRAGTDASVAADALVDGFKGLLREGLENEDDSTNSTDPPT